MNSPGFINQTTQYFDAYRSDAYRSDDSRVAGEQVSVAQGFSRGLSAGLGLKLAPVAQNNPATPLFDIQKVINTVASFIESRVSQAKADGASRLELEDMLGQARKGVELGFAQARDEIAQVLLPDNEISAPVAVRIDAAERGIYDRVDLFEEGLINDGGVSVTLPEVESFSYAQRLVRESASFEFTLVTQDGDTVHISAYEQSEQFTSKVSVSDGNEALGAALFESSKRSAFALRVTGELDDDEALAIQNLLAKVSELADEFYQGSLDVAFGLALKLDADASEIAKFSLDLTSSRLEAVSLGESRRSDHVNAYPKHDLPEGLLKPLAGFAEGIKHAFDLASTFREPIGLLSTLIKQLEAQREIIESASSEVSLGAVSKSILQALAAPKIAHNNTHEAG